MAGLSDMSMGEIQTLDDDSMANLPEGDDEDDEITSGGSKNILDGLKIDLEKAQAQKQNLNDSKMEDIKNTYRKTVVYDENEEDYDSSDDESEEQKSQKEESKQRSTRLMDLVKKKKPN